MSKMIILILHNLEHFDELLSRWHDEGAPAVTVIECVGTRSVGEQGRRDDLPLLPRVRDLLQADDAPRKMIISIVPDGAVDRVVDATEEIVGDLSEPRNGILAVLPLERVVGLREASDQPRQ